MEFINIKNIIMCDKQDRSAVLDSIPVRDYLAPLCGGYLCSLEQYIPEVRDSLRVYGLAQNKAFDAVSDPYTTPIVFMDAQDPSGMAIIRSGLNEHNERTLDIYDFYAKVKRQGIGSRMLMLIIDEYGAEEVFFKIHKDNYSAKEFWNTTLANFGYKLIENKKDATDKSMEDQLWTI